MEMKLLALLLASVVGFAMMVMNAEALDLEQCAIACGDGLASARFADYDYDVDGKECTNSFKSDALTYGCTTSEEIKLFVAIAKNEAKKGIRLLRQTKTPGDRPVAKPASETAPAATTVAQPPVTQPAVIVTEGPIVTPVATPIVQIVTPVGTPIVQKALPKEDDAAAEYRKNIKSGKWKEFKNGE